MKEMKSGKVPGMGGFPLKCFQWKKNTNYQTMVPLNLSFDMGVVHIDWRGACIVPHYKGKGDKCECSNSKGISLFSVVGKQYGRLQIR